MGITIETISPGDGKTFAQAGQQVTMHYVGTLANGKIFDSSRDKAHPFTCIIGVGHVIKGWDKGIPRLSLGQKAILTCPPDHAYGPRGLGGMIPPNATLKFEIVINGCVGNRSSGFVTLLGIQPNPHRDQKHQKPQQSQAQHPVTAQARPKYQGEV